MTSLEQMYAVVTYRKGWFGRHSNYEVEMVTNSFTKAGEYAYLVKSRLPSCYGAKVELVRCKGCRDD